jgi:hypothetical protein
MGPYRRRLATYRLYHLLVDRNQPVITIRKPSTNPINIPILTLLINIPTTRPSTMANIKAISPRLILGFLSMFVVSGFSFMVRLAASVKTPLPSRITHHFGHSPQRISSYNLRRQLSTVVNM